MKNYVILYSTHKEWGKAEVEAETPLQALIGVYGAPLEGIEVTPHSHLYKEMEKFTWGDPVSEEYFTGVIAPVESLEKDCVYVYKHDFEELVQYSNSLNCYKDIVKDLGESYGLEEAEETLEFLMGSEDTLNTHLQNWGATTIFVM